MWICIAPKAQMYSVLEMVARIAAQVELSLLSVVTSFQCTVSQFSVRIWP